MPRHTSRRPNAIPGYPREPFLADLVDEAFADDVSTAREIAFEKIRARVVGTEDIVGREAVPLLEDESRSQPAANEVDAVKRPKARVSVFMVCFPFDEKYAVNTADALDAKNGTHCPIK